MDGISVDRIVGFEELGGKDEFPTLLLARRLIKSGCLRAMNKKEKGEIKIKLTFNTGSVLNVPTSLTGCWCGYRFVH